MSAARKNMLTELERAEYEALKHLIGQNRPAWRAVAAAAAKIKAEKLYREEYATWEAFCKAEMGESARSIDLKIHAAEETGKFCSNDSFTIDKLSHQTALNGYAPPMQRRIMERLKETVESGARLTAGLINQTAQRLDAEDKTAAQAARQGETFGIMAPPVDEEEEEPEEEKPSVQERAAAHPISRAEQKAKKTLQAVRLGRKVKRSMRDLDMTLDEWTAEFVVDAMEESGEDD